MGDRTTETTQTSGLNNAALNTAVTTIGNQLNTQLGQGSKGYTESMVPNLSGQTQTGVNSIMSAAGNTGGITAANNWARGTVDSGGYNNALRGAQSGVQSYVDAASADNPAYQAAKQNLINDVTASTNAAFNASGRFGGRSNVESLSEGLSRGLISLESDRMNRQLAGNQALAGLGQTAMGNAAGAAASLPGFYQAGLMPGSAQLQAGQIMDQYNTAKAQDAARIFDARENAGWNTLQRGAGVLAGTAPSAGTTGTTTQTQQVPWWQTGLGIGAGLMSFM